MFLMNFSVKRNRRPFAGGWRRDGRVFFVDICSGRGLSCFFGGVALEFPKQQKVCIYIIYNTHLYIL